MLYHYYKIVIDKLFFIFLAVITILVVLTILIMFIFLGQEAFSIFFDAGLEVNILDLFLPGVFGSSGESWYLWQPHSSKAKFNIFPLLLGSLKITLIAMLVAVPLGILSAIYVSSFAFKKIRDIIKVVIEFFAAIPTVVFGFFALMIFGDIIRDFFGLDYRLNALTAGFALGLHVLAIIFTLSEEVLSGVPRSYLEASLSLGADWGQSVARVVIPASLPGILASIILAFGRALGETMIILMAAGGAFTFSFDFTLPTTSITAAIASGIGEAVVGDSYYVVLFFLGFLLLIFSSFLNYIADVFITFYKKRIKF